MMATFRRSTFLALALTAIVALIPRPAGAVTNERFAELTPLDDDRLEELRGGLDAGLGLVASFAWERIVTVNGDLMARQIFVIHDAAQMLQGALPSVQVIASANQIVQNGLGNFVGTATNAPPAPPAATPGAAPAAAAPTSAAAPASAAGTPVSASTAPVQTSAPAPTASAPAAAPASAAPSPAVQPSAPAPTASAPAAAPASAAAPAPAAQAAAPAASSPAPPAPAAAAASGAQPLTIQATIGGVTVSLPNTAAIVQNTQHNATIQVNSALTAVVNALSLANALANSAAANAAISRR